MDFFHSEEIYPINVEDNYWILLLKQGQKLLKAATKKVAHKAAEATGKFIGNKIANKIEKPKLLPDENSRNVEEVIIPPEKREKILNELRQVLYKWNTIKYLSC